MATQTIETLVATKTRMNVPPHRLLQPPPLPHTHTHTPHSHCVGNIAVYEIQYRLNTIDIGSCD